MATRCGSASAARPITCREGARWRCAARPGPWFRSKVAFSNRWMVRRDARSRRQAGAVSGLDGVNFFVAAVQTGFGSFITVYLVKNQWPPDAILSSRVPASVACGGGDHRRSPLPQGQSRRHGRIWPAQRRRRAPDPAEAGRSGRKSRAPGPSRSRRMACGRVSSPPLTATAYAGNAWDVSRSGKHGVVADRCHGGEHETAVSCSRLDPPFASACEQNTINLMLSSADKPIDH